MIYRHSLIVIILLAAVLLKGQNTVGLLSYEEDLSYDGYNLLFPHNQSDVFLIDHCGQIVNVWEDEDFRPGNSVYLTSEGNLVKCKRRSTSAINDPIWAGGGGEIVEILSWENELIAQYELNDSLRRLHHDVALMPNGNILMIAWELKTLEESLAAGRDPAKIAQDKLWPEVILEWNPSIDSIVWEWHTWDHLIQDFDNSKANFGIVRDHPELIDLNYDEHDGHPDWLHSNAIDYNSELDQVLLSIPEFNEFWIIDHSTTTEEAAGHTGGRSGKGGDLIYRWGNPKTYQRGDSSNQKLFFQHDVHWVDPNARQGDKHFNRIVLFNNRISTLLSQTNSMILPWDQDNISYSLSSGVYGPEDFELTVTHPDQIIRSNSNSLSSAQLLPNDNFLICSGRWGYTFEVTPGEEVAWEYITPIIRGQRAEQGDTSLTISSNLTFRVKRYGSDFTGFAEKDLSPEGYIEINPDTTVCNNIIVSQVDVASGSLTFYPNPATTMISITSTFDELGLLGIYDINGRLLYHNNVRANHINIDIQDLNMGIYFVKSSNNRIMKFIKL